MKQESIIETGKTINFLSNYIPITVFETKVYALLDSGSDLCVVNYNVFNKYKHFDKNLIVHSDKECITTAGGKRVKIDGMINVTASVADYRVYIKFYLVKNLLTDFIVGLDFLKRNNVNVDFGNVDRS